MDFNSSEVAVTWLRDNYLERKLVIKPPYQRNPVWASRQKCSLVETILLKLPVPEIFIQQSSTPDGKTTYAIVDGQQRVRSVLQFVGAETDPHEQEANKFSLDSLEPTSPWRGKSFADLNDDEKARFYNYRFAVRYLNTGIENEVRDMFKRLNKFLTPLNAQELRNAIYTGPFIALATKLADDNYWALNKIVTPHSIRRMGDIELTSELLIGAMHGPQGGSAKAIDEYYERLEDYDGEFPDQPRVEELFRETLEAIKAFLPSIGETRWSNRTDFYTLFVACASLLRTRKLPKKNYRPLRARLIRFAEDVATRLADEDAKATSSVVEYVRAVEKGANDKMRRARRHDVMVKLLGDFFIPKAKNK